MQQGIQTLALLKFLFWVNTHYVRCIFSLFIILSAEFCPELPDPIGGVQTCKDWGAGGQFKVCEVSCNPGLRFSREIPKFYTCGGEGFWRPTTNPTLPMVYPACSSKLETQQ